MFFGYFFIQYKNIQIFLILDNQVILILIIKHLQHTCCKCFKNNNSSILILLNKFFSFRKKKENMDACFLFTLLVCDRYCDHAQCNRNVESMFVS